MGGRFDRWAVRETLQTVPVGVEDKTNDLLNTYARNTCRVDGLGTSLPIGLCETSISWGERSLGALGAAHIRLGVLRAMMGVVLHAPVGR
jgi:hypothetical protein